MNEPRAFDNTQQAQPQQAQPQAYPDDPVSTFLGTGLESVIDMASFGLLQPDIVPDYVERRNQIAATMGHVAGSVAGILPSFGVAGAAVNGALKLTKFGRGVVTAAEAGGMLGKAAQAATTTAFGSRIVRPFASGMGRTALTMMTHDVTREYIRQTKEADPDLARIGEVAFDAAISGGAIGYFGTITHASHPLIQANALGSAFGVAEAINGAADGEDVFSAEFLGKTLPTAYLQGFGMALLFNAPKWKMRKAGEQQKLVDAFIKRMTEAKGTTPLKEIEAITGRKFGKGVELPEGLLKAVDAVAKYRAKASPSARSAQGRIQQVRRNLNLPEDVYRNILKESAGITTTSKQPVEKLTKVINALEMEISKAPELANIARFKRPGWIQGNLGLSPSDELVRATNLIDYVRDVEAAKKLMMIEQGLASNAITTWRNRWKEGWKKAFPDSATPLKTRVKNALLGETPDPVKRFGDYVQGKRPTTELTPELNEIVKQYKFTTDVYFNRLNQVRDMFGLGKLNYVEFYQRHAIDVPAMIRAGREKGLGFLDFPGTNRAKRPFGAMEQSTEKSRTAGKNPPIYLDDPFEALKNMVRYDLKAIYLREPIKIGETLMRKMNRTMAPDGRPVLSDEGLELGMKYMKHVIWGVPTEGTQKLNKLIRQKLDTKPGEAIEKVLAQFNVDMGGNPAKMINRFWGSMVSRAYIGLRPRLAIRNSFQVMYTHGFVDTKNLVKGFRTENDALFQKILNKSPFWKLSAGQSGENIGVGSMVDRVAFNLYQQSHVLNVERTMRATYYQTMDYIKADKYKSLGWRDAEGVKLRKKNPNALSEREMRLVKEHVDFIASHSQFLYNAVGLPMVTRSDAAAPLFKLLSYPMNYRYKYVNELFYQARHGSPSWTKGMKDAPKLPWNVRAGLLKHFVGLGVLVGGMEQLGVDYTSLLGVYATGKEKRGTKGLPFTDLRVGLGVFNMRPSPAMSVLLNIKDAVSSNPYTAEMGRRNLRRGIPGLLPGASAVGDIKRAVEEGDRTEMFTYKVYEKPKKTQPFKSFGGFSAPKPFKGF